MVVLAQVTNHSEATKSNRISDVMKYRMVALKIKIVACGCKPNVYTFTLYI